MHKGVKAAAFASCISIVGGSIVMLVFLLVIKGIFTILNQRLNSEIL